MLTDFLATQAGAIATQLQAAITAATTAPVAKHDGLPDVDPDLVGRILRAISFDDWAAIVSDVESGLLEVLLAGHAAGFAQIGVPPLPAMTAQVHELALVWADARAAELVGRRRLASGTLVPNPSARWAITESTREALRADVVQALTEGWSTDRLASALADGYAFSPARADLIARTETARADVEGNLAAYRASGEVAGKRLLLGSEHAAEEDPDECDAAAALGVVPLDDDFGGAGDPPLHPRCKCDVMPVLAED